MNDTTPTAFKLADGEAPPEGWGVLDRPVEAPGTPEEKAANYHSHWWQTIGDPEDCEVYCMHCDSKPWHTAANYPCGVDVPRERIAIPPR